MGSHKRVVKQVEFTDRDGKTRVRNDVTYVRSEQTEKDMEELRLGKFSRQATTKDPTALGLFKNSQQIVICSHFIARTLTATRLRKDPRVYKSLTGGELLTGYLDQGDGGSSTTLLEGFINFPSLYLFFGFSDAPNSYVPHLLVQLIGQRYHNAAHVWLFVPTSLEQLAIRYKNDVLQDLNYLPTTRLMQLSDIETDIVAGPSVATREIAPTEAVDIPEEIKGQVKDDPKFADPNKPKWKT